MDWQNNTVSFVRKKNGAPVLMHLGGEALNLLKDLPSEGPLFPYLSTVRAGDRATEFKQRCNGLGISGVSLHSYRYAWAERALKCGFPERFAQQALGHNSKAVHLLVNANDDTGVFCNRALTFSISNVMLDPS